MALPTREEAMDLLRTHTQNENLIKHMLAVEASMRAYARKFGEDEALWGITGLLHDFDYEKHPTPDEHPMFGVRILEEKGYPGDMIHAIKAPRHLPGRAPRKPPGQSPLCRGRTHRFHRRRHPDAAHPETRRPESLFRAQEIETERLCAHRQPGRHPDRRRRTGHPPGGTHRLRHRGDGGHRRRPGTLIPSLPGDPIPI